MACNIELADVAPCDLRYNSSRVQQESLLVLLCAALNKIDGVFACGDWNAILALAEARGLLCVSQGVNNAKQAQIVCDGAGRDDCGVLTCFSDADLAAMRTYLTCRLINVISP